MFLLWEELPEQPRASSTSATTTTRMPTASAASRRYWSGGRFPVLSDPIDGLERGVCSARGLRGGGPASGSGPPPEGRVTAVSCVPPVSSQSESKKSSGATGRTLSACPDMGNCRSLAVSGQSHAHRGRAGPSDPHLSTYRTPGGGPLHDRGGARPGRIRHRLRRERGRRRAGRREGVQPP